MTAQLITFNSIYCTWANQSPEKANDQELHYSQVENRTRSSGCWPIALCIFLVLEFMEESAAHIKYLF